MNLWSLGIPATDRLYTSVIVRNPEKRAYKESCTTDMSPTALFYCWDMPVHRVRTEERHGWGVPGVGSWVGAGGGYTGTQAQPVPGP